jgi:hypothetical protein
VPRLRHIEHQSVLVDRLKGEGNIGWNKREKARVRITVAILRFDAVCVRLSNGYFTKYA